MRSPLSTACGGTATGTVRTHITANASSRASAQRSAAAAADALNCTSTIIMSQGASSSACTSSLPVATKRKSHRGRMARILGFA
jgi:hypothetical protein